MKLSLHATSYATVQQQQAQSWHTLVILLSKTFFLELMPGEAKVLCHRWSFLHISITSFLTHHIFPGYAPVRHGSITPIPMSVSGHSTGLWHFQQKTIS